MLLPSHSSGPSSWSPSAVPKALGAGHILLRAKSSVKQGDTFSACRSRSSSGLRLERVRGSVSLSLGGFDLAVTTDRIGVRLVFAFADFFSAEPAFSVGKLGGIQASRADRDLHFPSGGQWPRKLTHAGRLRRPPRSVSPKCSPLRFVFPGCFCQGRCSHD